MYGGGTDGAGGGAGGGELIIGGKDDVSERAKDKTHSNRYISSRRAPSPHLTYSSASPQHSQSDCVIQI